MDYNPYEDQEEFRDSIATVDKEGKRQWIYPKKPSGTFYNYRKLLSYLLLLVLFGLPFIKINGNPLFLFNVLERKFILFGKIFMPTDFYIFALVMITFVIFIILFTVIFGRLFCGWICPQTIFMEMVFRRIEYAIEGDYTAQKKLNAAPWDANKIFKKSLKQVIFFSISVIIANLFLSYIIGIDEVFKIISEPIGQHLSGFLGMLVFAFLFYGVFSIMREQVCVTICPYGRLQGVMLDKNSIVITYDWLRGEPRGRLKKQKDPAIPLPVLGDCIDCNLCVKVCPTGIDIRNGTQLECVNCTACIDECDTVMEKIGKPKGLIRYDSHEGVLSGGTKIFNARTVAYSIVLVLLILLDGVLLFNKSDLDFTVFRAPGQLYQKDTLGNIKNLYQYKLINKTNDDLPIDIGVSRPDASIEFIGAKKDSIFANEQIEGVIYITIPRSSLTKKKNEIEVNLNINDEVVESKKVGFISPTNK
jgi:cytochrome c oxidase accessory protein FixG